MIVNPFNPAAGTGQEVTTTAASASVNINESDKCVRVYNSHATVDSYIRLGDSVGGTVTITCTTNDLLLKAGDSIILYKNDLDRLAFLRKGASDGSLAISTGNDGT